VVEAQAELALRSLTAREREVLDLLALGATNAEIAGELYISERTAKFYVRNIIGKLELADRRQAVERATGFGLVGEG
jgi:DNA-binding NarL/FixJ family response regulator